jgi:hypothetical protein
MVTQLLDLKIIGASIANCATVQIRHGRATCLGKQRKRERNCSYQSWPCFLNTSALDPSFRQAISEVPMATRHQRASRFLGIKGRKIPASPTTLDPNPRESNKDDPPSRRYDLGIEEHPDYAERRHKVEHLPRRKRDSADPQPSPEFLETKATLWKRKERAF